MSDNESYSHDISVLNELITTTLDSVDGYTVAAKDADNVTFKNLFYQWAGERREVVSELREQVRLLGGEPEEDGSALASAQRMFLHIRNSLSGGDKGVVEEVERGEDYIKRKYEDALEDNELSLSVRPIVNRAYASVIQGHDQARALKRTYHHH